MAILNGGKGNDILIGTTKADTLNGYEGNDILNGGGGNDTLIGGIGSDTLNGGEGDDALWGQAVSTNYYDPPASNASIDYLYGNGGNDSIFSLGSNYIDGGTGDDLIYQFISFSSASSILNSVNAFTQDPKQALSYCFMVPNSSQDNPEIYGGDGNDKIFVYKATLVDAGAGDDYVFAGRLDSDSQGYNGGLGYDTLVVNGSSMTANDMIGSSTYDSSKISNFEQLIFSGWQSGEAILPDSLAADSSTFTVQIADRYSDTDTTAFMIDASAETSASYIFKVISKDAYGNYAEPRLILKGGAADDVINGGFKDDQLFGNAGNDTLTGGAGDDTLTGGSGDDVIDGGNGNDIAVFSGNYADYVITDSYGEVVISGLDGVDSLRNINQYVFHDQTIVHEFPGLYLVGTEDEDTLEGSDGDDFVSGLNGNDSIETGLGDDRLNGGYGNDVLNGGQGNDVLEGGMGNDIYVVNDSLDSIVELSGQGTDTIEASINIALNDSQSIEVITLTGTDSINATGNSANNTVSGNNASNVIETGSGNDVVYAGGGDDVIVGGHGEGDDTYDGGTGSHDRIKYLSALNGIIINLATGQAYATAGNDAAGIGIDTLSNIEDVTAGNYDDIIIGNSEANSIDGALGNDTIDGGAGNDVAKYSGNFSDYTLTNNLNGSWIVVGVEGSDTITRIENIQFADQLYSLIYEIAGTANADRLNGTAGEDSIDGLAGNDTVYGYAGNDILVGGLGADKLIGGLGDDTYIINLTSKGALEDTVTEAKNQGADTIQLSGSYLGAVKTFTLGNDLENLNLSETGSSHINLKGNASDNILTGNDYANTLDGAAGADNLIGGAGNDTYVVDNAGDVVTEDSGDGTDTVQSSINYTLGSAIENLTLTGKAAINGTGNDLDNTLTGNAAANVLNGGIGNDNMVGGKGNDTYYVDATGDAVTEAANAGTDTIITSLSTYSISALTNLENLSYYGSSNAILTGNALINTLTGGTGNDTLAGGLGNDILTGGAGNDTFVFNTVANASKNKDIITDFVSGTDVIQFSKAIFTGLGTSAGSLTSDQFWSGAGVTKAHDADDRIIYNTTSGALYYDADGSGKAAAAVQVALIGASSHPTLAYTDMAII
jgi:Ca2+-binding RTX toxin-like protein